MKIIIVIIGIFAFSYWFMKKYVIQKPSKEDLAFFEIYRQADELCHTVSELRELENIITDLSLCSHKRLTAVTISLPNSLSEVNQKHTLLVDGNNRQSRCIMAAARQERADLRQQLLQQITSLQTRASGMSRTAVTESVTQTIGFQEGEK